MKLSTVANLRALGGSLLLVLAPTSALGDTADDVRCREVGFSLSVENGNREAFANFIDPDARFVGQSVLRGRQAVVDAWGVFFLPDATRLAWRPRFVEVLENGQLALSRGPYRLITTDEAGQRTEAWGTFNSVWRLNADGQWRVVFDAGSEPLESPAESVRALLEAPTGCPEAP